MRMPAGKLRDRVQVQSPSTTTNAIGEKVVSFANSGSPIWGEALDELRGEVADTATTKGFRTVKVKLRTASVSSALSGGTLSTKHRLLIGSRVLNITSIAQSQESGKALLITCTEAC